MTTSTPLQTIFAIVVLMACLIAGLLTRRASARESMQRQRDQLSITPGDPENAWLDDSTSFSANAVCALGEYLAVAIVSGNLLWALSLFHLKGETRTLFFLLTLVAAFFFGAVALQARSGVRRRFFGVLMLIALFYCAYTFVSMFLTILPQ